MWSPEKLSKDRVFFKIDKALRWKKNFWDICQAEQIIHNNYNFSNHDIVKNQ